MISRFCMSFKSSTEQSPISTMVGLQLLAFNCFASFLESVSHVPVCEPKRIVTGVAGAAAALLPFESEEYIPARKPLSHAR